MFVAVPFVRVELLDLLSLQSAQRNQALYHLKARSPNMQADSADQIPHPGLCIEPPSGEEIDGTIPGCRHRRDTVYKLRKLSQSHTGLQVWALLGQQARPLLDRVPALRTPLGYVERWFCNPR